MVLVYSIEPGAAVSAMPSPWRAVHRYLREYINRSPNILCRWPPLQRRPDLSAAGHPLRAPTSCAAHLLHRRTSVPAPQASPGLFRLLCGDKMAAADGGGASVSGCGLKRRHAATVEGDEVAQHQPPGVHAQWSNGMDLLRDVTENKCFLPAGLEGIDKLLGGGLRQGQLTEITGPSSSGKTQFCLRAASHVAAWNKGVVIYLDTSNSFSPRRIASIIDEFPMTSVREPKDVRLERIMRSIIYESVFDVFSLFEVLHRLEHSLQNDKVADGSKICILIIDSVSSLLAPIIGGKYPQGRSMMMSVAMILKKLADKHNLSVLVTNHMVSAGNGALKPALGQSWRTVPHVRLMLSYDRGRHICTATVLKHTLLASGRTVKFMVPSLS